MEHVPDMSTWMLSRVGGVCAAAECEQDLQCLIAVLAVVYVSMRVLKSCVILCLDALLAFDGAFAIVDCAAACTV